MLAEMHKIRSELEKELNRQWGDYIFLGNIIDSSIIIYLKFCKRCMILRTSMITRNEEVIGRERLLYFDTYDLV